MGKEMVKEVVDSIMTRLDAVAAKLGITVEQIWPWLVRQQYVEAFYPLAVFAMFSILGYMAYRFVKKVRWKSTFTIEQCMGIIFGVVSVVGIFCSFIACLVETPHIFNAEYHALKDLIRMVR